eukprot:TRINITY_DN9901_c0_g1_i1.p1 TRINITY_DN9901_c0_g1~~TRINITY_DN9901_c0_g1_i1.p1  ORF type:complete len:510 (-),score=45.18 TRINITY_DN9901_c0_g1_i1:39-1568(-)
MGGGVCFCFFNWKTDDTNTNMRKLNIIILSVFIVLAIGLSVSATQFERPATPVSMEFFLINGTIMENLRGEYRVVFLFGPYNESISTYFNHTLNPSLLPTLSTTRLDGWGTFEEAQEDLVRYPIGSKWKISSPFQCYSYYDCIWNQAYWYTNWNLEEYYTTHGVVLFYFFQLGFWLFAILSFLALMKTCLWQKDTSKHGNSNTLENIISFLEDVKSLINFAECCIAIFQVPFLNLDEVSWTFWVIGMIEIAIRVLPVYLPQSILLIFLEYVQFQIYTSNGADWNTILGLCLTEVSLVLMIGILKGFSVHSEFKQLRNETLFGTVVYLLFTLYVNMSVSTRSTSPFKQEWFSVVVLSTVTMTSLANSRLHAVAVYCYNVIRNADSKQVKQNLAPYLYYTLWTVPLNCMFTITTAFVCGILSIQDLKLNRKEMPDFDLRLEIFYCILLAFGSLILIGVFIGLFTPQLKRFWSKRSRHDDEHTPILRIVQQENIQYEDSNAVSYTHLTLPTT